MLQIYTEYLFVGKVGIFVYRVEFHCVVQFYFYIIAGPLQRQYRREIDSDKKKNHSSMCTWTWRAVSIVDLGAIGISSLGISDSRYDENEGSNQFSIQRPTPSRHYSIFGWNCIWKHSWNL